MEAGIPPQWKAQWEQVATQLQDPFKLRIVTLGAVALLGFFAAYRPMDTKIQVLRRDLKAAQQRLATIRQVEQLRATRLKLLESLPEDATLNFWQQHFLVGIREANVQLRALESLPKKQKMGDFQVFYLEIEADGEYAQIHKLVSWIENSRWFTRIIRVQAKGKHGTIQAKMTVAVLVAPDKKTHGA
jgi:hypothetical protein